MRKDTETIGNRLWRFIALVGMVAGITLAAVIGERITRLSQDALAMGGGIILGLLVGLVPALIVLAVMWMIGRVLLERERVKRSTQQTYGPQVYVVPPMMGGMPGMYPPQQGAFPEMQPVSREFRVIGE